MTNQQILSLVGFSALLAVGQTMFKISAMGLPGRSNGPQQLLALAFSPIFWAALVLYGCGTLLWIVILQSVPLSKAYPFAALGFVIVPVLAFVIFGEKLTLGYAFGVGLIVAGIVVTANAG